MVAVTRSIDDNRPLAAELAERGWRVVSVPLIEVVAPADGGRELDRALSELDRYRWVVLTSVNAVRAIAQRRSGQPWPAAVEVAVVGPTTGRAADQAGLPVDLVPTEATAEALVEAFPHHDGGNPRVLAPLAALASSTVQEGLAAKGWLVERVEAYRTIAPETSIADSLPVGVTEVAVVTFFSPSAVDRWVDLLGPGALAATAVCIGPSTAARARARGFTIVVTADPHTEAGVVESVGLGAPLP